MGHITYIYTLIKYLIFIVSELDTLIKYLIFIVSELNKPHEDNC